MVTLIFYIAAVMAIGTTLAVILNPNPVYAVLYLVLSLFSVSLVFWTLGSPFLAILEVIVYAGAIMVLFLFVVMMLNLGTGKGAPDLRIPTGKQLLVPGVLAGILALATFAALGASPAAVTSEYVRVSAKDIGKALFTKHYLGVELASLVLLIGMVGGMHLGRAAHPKAVSKEEASDAR